MSGGVLVDFAMVAERDDEALRCFRPTASRVVTPVDGEDLIFKLPNEHRGQGALKLIDPRCQADNITSEPETSCSTMESPWHPIIKLQTCVRRNQGFENGSCKSISLSIGHDRSRPHNNTVLNWPNLNEPRINVFRNSRFRQNFGERTAERVKIELAGDKGRNLRVWSGRTIRVSGPAPSMFKVQVAAPCPATIKLRHYRAPT
jgi:hypothetical protein